VSVESDERGIRKVIRALLAADWRLDFVDDGGEDIPVHSEQAAIDEIMAVSEATLYVKRDAQTGYCVFVMGNEDDDMVVLNDYTINLDPALAPLYDED
jgi:hypothetical protein